MLTRYLRMLAILCLFATAASAQSLLDVTADTPAPAGSPAPAEPATTPPDAATTRRALDAFLAVYWDEQEGLVSKYEIERPAPIPAASNPLEWIGNQWERLRRFGKDLVPKELSASKAPYWWVPHMMEMATDAYELSHEARDRALLDRLHYGMWEHYWWRTNKFNDDLGWLMVASLRAYEVTGDTKFRDDAAKLHGVIRKSMDDRYGGGIDWLRWNLTKFKNVPINAPFVIASWKLFNATHEERYKNDALAVHDWMVRTLWHDGPLDDGIDKDGPVRNWYTYNYGTFIGACLLTYDGTGDAKHLEMARKAADFAIANLAPNGIVKDEGGGDGAGFKMIFTRYLVELARRPGGEKYVAFLDRNAASAWEHRRRKDDIMGYSWAATPPERGVEAFTAAAGIEVMLQARRAHGAAHP